MNEMKTRYRLTSRGIRGGMFYCVDKVTGKRTSLQTTNKDEAQQIVDAKNNSLRQPRLRDVGETRPRHQQAARPRRTHPGDVETS